MKKFLAVVCALIVLVLFPIVLLGTLTRYRLLTRPVIKHVIRASQVGENLPTLATTLLKQSAEQDAEFALDETTTQTFIQSAFAPDTLYGITDSLVDAIGLWWPTQQPIEQLNLRIDLSSAKRQLVPAINEQFGQLMPDIPTCATDVIPSDVPAELGDFSQMFNLTCLPTDQTTGITASIGDTFTRNIPDTVDAQDLLQQQLVAQGGANQLVMINQQINQYRLYWQWLNWLIWIGWGVIGLCTVLIILLRLKPGFAPFGWLGWLHVLMTIEVAPILLVVWLAPQFLLPWISGTFDTAIVVVIQNALTALFAVYLWPLIWVLFGTFVGSIIWFIIRGIVKHHIAHK